MADPSRPGPARNGPKRPDPDALLALSDQEGREATSRGGAARGALKIFLGAAPGVGKTFAMLQAAQRLRAEGQEVVIGLIETHGRAETEALVAGLETLPRRQLIYRGVALAEFDIDAALARRPRLLVVDELAHTNAPDSRHPKRWQDVKELLDAGIDVWTALNIQHLESLADIVSHITGIAVRETVPDTILRTAQAVVLVDITPDELITRLKAGKVYLPQTAQRATENFFTPGNLTALRELALRQTADRVEDQMTQLLRQKAIEGPWGTSERLLVCIGADAGAVALVRKTSRLATNLNAGWIAVHLARPDRDTLDPEAERRITESLTLAETLGAEVLRLVSSDFTADLLALARRENVTQILIGRSRVGRARQLFGRLFGAALSDQLVAMAQDIGVQVVPLPHPVARLPGLGMALRRPGWLRDAAAAAVATLAAAAAGSGLNQILLLPNLSMVFLVAVLFCAVSFGTRSAVIAAFLSFVAYNFLFIEPVHTLTIARPHEFFALLIFLGIAVLTGSLTGRVRDQALAALRRSRSMQALFEFSRKLSAASTADEVLWATVSQVHNILGGKAILLLNGGEGLQTQAAWPPDDLTDPAEQSAARWALEKREAAGWKTGTLPNVRFRFQPLITQNRVVAVLGYEPPDRSKPMPADDDAHLNAIAEQAAIALDRVQLVGEAVKAAALQENENIRDALLSSLSHDLRTPLASITGAVSSLRQLGDLPEAQRQELLLAIDQEAARLSRFVSNLLDMSRIESGAIKMRRDWVDVADAIRSAVERLQKTHAGRKVKLSIAPGLRFVRGDQDLLIQVIYNLLDNAHKYGGEGEISLHARDEAKDVVISVTDEGPGIKPSDLERVFEKFYRAGGADRRKPGTGLGLSICRGLVASMGGVISAESPAVRRRGTRLLVRLPAAELPADLPSDASDRGGSA
ncbi:histidine kinase [Cypionkella aquatica]|uniref:histidine kinase n=1 Tax=Cypionkella aquatica TaxID=1756042 RepID=A0AA37TTM8_9RHOB|nr:sensor histidine kinase KdpD [Cypionkella aquatica]GLS85590.1 histidine kinase [Cypionkella aquatica]